MSDELRVVRESTHATARAAERERMRVTECERVRAAERERLKVSESERVSA